MSEPVPADDANASPPPERAPADAAEPTPDAVIGWFEGIACTTRPLRAYAGQAPSPVVGTCMQPPAHAGRWRWEGVLTWDAKAEGWVWSLVGRWTELPPWRVLERGLTWQDPQRPAIAFEVRAVFPNEVRLALVEKGKPGFQLVTVPRSVVEETLLWLPAPTPAVEE